MKNVSYVSSDSNVKSNVVLSTACLLIAAPFVGMYVIGYNVLTFFWNNPKLWNLCGIVFKVLFILLVNYLTFTKGMAEHPNVDIFTRHITSLVQTSFIVLFIMCAKYMFREIRDEFMFLWEKH